jgi:2-keto-4-pentenoate hydratase/2-oxohepta-3-ene-1,7-dioic acid hydratase in catechol pathway
MNANLPGRDKRFGDEFFDWLTGKWCDTFAPIGPVITTADEITDPSQLTIITRLNGEEVQNSGTSKMLFNVPKLISYISEFVTLEPGDVISTGTPAGVGLAKGRFLQPGDMIECEIKGIGTLTNPVTGSY